MEKAALSTTGIPYGTILAFAGEGNRIPKGWLLCDGTEVSKENYPRLFEAIGTVWGGSATPNFYLPDLRGMFLRGVSGETNIDPDKTSRASPQAEPNPGNAGNNVGSVQQHTYQNHGHSVEGRFLEAAGGSGFNGYGFESNSREGRKDFGTKSNGGNETRPINAYVFYIIKADD